jgi:hypothetical protein
VEAGLVEGSKLHVDVSLVDADTDKESVIKGTPELITALKRAYRTTESKLEESRSVQEMLLLFCTPVCYATKLC